MLTRAVFGVLFWPMVALFATLAGILLLFYLYAVQPLLAVAIVVTFGVAVWLAMRWRDQRRPPIL